VWLYGRHAVLAAVGNPRRRLLRLVGLPATLAEVADSARRAPVARPRPESTDRHTLAHLLPPGAVHQGYAALAEPLDEIELETLLASLDAAAAAVLLVLDQATDPRNVGTILRSAAAFGADGVIVQSRHAPPASGVLAKAASGALEHVPLIRVVNIARTIRSLRDIGFVAIGLDAEADVTLADAMRPNTSPHGLAMDTTRLALVLGSEGEGLRRLVGEACDVAARIPIRASVDSLNVAASAAIALYETRAEASRARPAAAESTPADDTASRIRSPYRKSPGRG